MSAQSFVVKQGAAWAQLVRFKCAGLNFAGASVTSQIRKSAKDEEVAFEFTIAPTVPYLGAIEALLQMTGEQSAGIPVGAYVGDVWIEVPGSFGPYGPVDFTMSIVPRVTRPAT